METSWDDYKEESAKSYLRDLLKENEVLITFQKNDGTERKMLCSLNENKIPEEKKAKGTGKKINTEVLPVFDIEKQEWRSFRYDSIKFIEINYQKST
jgi:sorbitol-specific phosphotransferase system component IIA